MTVEESLAFEIGHFQHRLDQDSSGKFIWTRRDGSESTIGYSFHWNDGFPAVTLAYRWADAPDDEGVRLVIRLQTTATNFNGRRWRFTCPLIKDEKACGRRVNTLYLPPGERDFGCRECHNLTYQSSRDSQDSNRVEEKIDSIQRFLERKIKQLDESET